MFARLKLPLIRIVVFISFSVLFLYILSCDNGSSHSAENETFSISYNANGAESGGVPAKQKGDIQSAQSIQANVGNLAKNGYVFDGWNTIADGSGTNYSPGTVYMGSKNLTLYAKWVALFNYQVINPGSPASSLNGIQRIPATSYASITGLTERGSQLSDINIPEQIDGYMIASIGDNAFKNCSAVSNITIPVTVTSIGDSAFAGCSAITDITIPASVTSIGNEAFSNCASLTNLVMLSTTPPTMGDDVLADTAATISVPVAGVTAYNEADGWNTYSSNIAGYSTEVLTVTFDPQGGTFAATEATVKVVPPAVTVGQLPSDPVFKGYKFGGWNTQADGQGIEFTASTAVPNNMTVYAKWISHRYTVTFDDQEATTPVGEISVIVESPDTTLKILPSEPAKTGSYFSGWFTQKNGEGSSFNEKTEVIGDITVYAYWTAAPVYTIIFDSQGAETDASPGRISVENPATTVVSLPIPPIKTGHDFGGWFTETNGGGTEFLTDTAVTENLTVYAKWTPSTYAITYKDHGDTAFTGIHGNNYPKTHIYGTDTTLVNPTKDNHEFLGWYTTSDCSGDAVTSLGATVVTQNITLYAMWAERSDFFTYTINNSKVTITGLTDKGKELSVLEIPQMISGCPVAEIGEKAFLNCTNFTGTLTIPNGITRIGNRAFEGCTGFTGALSIPASVESIGNGAFFDCEGFTSLTLHEGLKEIGSCFNLTYNSSRSIFDEYGNYKSETFTKGVFSRCTGLTGVLSIPSSVTTIGDSAFRCCSFTGNLIIPSGVKNIGNCAFERCGGFTGNLSIPSSVTRIGYEAFRYCNGLTGSLTIGSGITSIEEEVFKCCGFTGTLTIPNSVTRIGNRAFLECSGFTGTLVIPSSVQTIELEAFAACEGFSGTLTIPSSVKTIKYGAFSGLEITGLIILNGVTSIGDWAFDGCSELTGTLSIPASVKTIGKHAFYNCTSLTGLIISDGVATIGAGAFGAKEYDGSNITGILSIPNSVKTIGEEAFEHCKFTEVTIPASVTSIGPNAFIGCNYIDSMTVDNNNTAYCVSDGLLYDKTKTTIFFCLPNNDTELTIPSSVVNIGQLAFSGIKNPIVITMQGKIPPSGIYYDRDDGRYYTCAVSFPQVGYSSYLLTKLRVPVDSITTYKHSTSWSLYSDKIVGDGYAYTVTFDSQGADTDASPSTVDVDSPATTVVKLPTAPIKEGYIFDGWNTKKDGTGAAFTEDTVVTGNIHVYAIWKDGRFIYEINNSKVTITDITPYGRQQAKLAIPETIEGYPVIGIGNVAFFRCLSLVEVSIPESIITIGDNAFSNCTSLTSITIPKNVISIGDKAFEKCVNLATINYNATNCTLQGNNIFSNCNKITTLNIGNKVETIPCFAGCTGLTSITIPDNVTKIEERAFSGCAGLVSVTLGTGLTSIRTGIFSNCIGLTSITIPNNVTSIESSAFSGCTGLINVTLSNELTSIGTSAFSGCTSLTSITIPNKVTNIGDMAFSGCTKLDSVTVQCNTPPSASYIIFSSCSKLRIIIVPQSAVSTYKTTWGWSDYYDKIVYNDYIYNVNFDSQGADTDAWPTALEVSSPRNTISTLPNPPIKEGYIFDGWNTRPDGLGTAFYSDTAVTDNITVYAIWKKAELFNYKVKNSVVTIKGLTTYGQKQTEIIIPETIEGYPVTAIQTIPDGSSVFSEAENLAHVTIPDSVTTIGSYAFSGCSNLASITIPENVTSIGNWAFERCTSLSIVTVKCNTPPRPGYILFSSCPELKTIIVPESSVDAYKSADGWSNYADIIEGYAEQ